MSNKRLVSFVALGIVLSVVFLLIGNNAVDKQKKNADGSSSTIKILFSVDYPEKDVILKDIKQKKLKVIPDSTVIEALEYLREQNYIDLTLDSDKKKVTGLNNISNGDFYDQSRWLLKLNGKSCKTPDKTKVKAGDEILLIFDEQ